MGFDSNASDAILYKEFSLLHRIVTKLTPIDLESQLLISTADIDSRCSEGKTPLYWAAVRNDVTAVDTLLRFGADITPVDIQSKSVLHIDLSDECLVTILRAATSGSTISGQKNSDPFENKTRAGRIEAVGLNEDLYKFFHQPDVFKFTPLACAAFDRSAPRSRILLAYGASAEVPGTIPALTVAVQMNAYAVIETLLQNGARQDVIDEEAQGVLHLAGSFGDLTTLNTLSRYLCCIKTDNIDVFGYTPLQVFNALRPTYTTEDEQTNALCREAFLRLLEGIKFHSKDHHCWANRFVSLDSDEKDVDVETESVCSIEKEDHFFDADSVVGEDVSNDVHGSASWCDSKDNYWN